MEFIRTFLMTSLIALLAMSALIGASYVFVSLARKFFRQRRSFVSFSLATFDIIENHSDIMQLLSLMHSQKVRFKIRLNNRGSSFNSALLKAEQSYLLIDALFPSEGNDLITDANFITIAFAVKEAENIPYIFRATFLSPEVYQGYPALRITFPQSIKRDQRRNYHRVEPSVHEPLYVTFIIDGSSSTNKVANISGGGVAFYTNIGKSILWTGKRIDLASIILPHYTISNCMAIVYTMSRTTYPVLIDGKPHHYLCGAEFVDMDNVTRDKIIRYVIEKERDELKRISREFE